MITNGPGTLTEKAIAAMRQAVDRVIADRLDRHQPLIVWLDGAIVHELPRPRTTSKTCSPGKDESSSDELQ